MRKRIFEIIEIAKEDDRASRFYDFFMISVIIISLLPLMFYEQNEILRTIDFVAGIIFICDYLLRLITADYKLKKGGYPIKFVLLQDAIDWCFAAGFLRSVRKMKLIVVGLGGTIICTSTSQTMYHGYGKDEKLKLKELIDSFESIGEIPAQVDAYEYGMLTSHQTKMSDYAALSLKIDSLLEDDGYDGAVITSGTDTLEELAYFLDLTLRSKKPVVVTGSMRPTACVPGNSSMSARVQSPDGPANIFHALTLAASRKTERFGVVVLFNDVVYPARDVTKTNTHRTDTFSSPLLGALGYVDTDEVSIYRLPVRAMLPDDKWETPFDLKKYLTLNENTYPATVDVKDGTDFSFAKVAVVPVYHDEEDSMLFSVASTSVDGIVLMGTGLGDIGPILEKAKKQLIEEKNIAFMQASRTGSGTVYARQITVHADKTDVPAFAADCLNAFHARILLTLILSFTKSVEQMHTWVNNWARLSL